MKSSLGKSCIIFFLETGGVKNLVFRVMQLFSTLIICNVHIKVINQN